jgi:hypothetical protein
MSTRTLRAASVAAAIAVAFSFTIAAAQTRIGPGGIQPGLGGGFKPNLPPGGFKPALPPNAGGLQPLPPGSIKVPPGLKPPVVANPCLIPGKCKPPVPPKPPGSSGGSKWVWGGITILATQYDGCGYEYYKWKSTGSKVWYRRYAECRGWY